jgi:hypothetical protein
MIDREKILEKAIEDCYREMYAKAQPSADWDKLIQDYNDGKIDEKKDGAVFNRHYLSSDEFSYIENKYLDAYRIESEWRNDVEIVEDYLKNGGSKTKYFDEYTDENGDFHPPHKGCEKVPPIKEQIEEMLKEYDSSNVTKEMAEKASEIVMNAISECKNFYRFNIDESKFRNTIAFGCSPTSNKETVKNWWKEHKGIDIEIKDKNPLLFWEYDYYGDEMDSIMRDEYGDDWEQQWWDKYNEQKNKKENVNGI